jgi:IS605 OrfB family transposase
VLLSYKYRIEPNRAQASAMDEMLAAFCDLYNGALEERIAAYRRCGVSVTFLNSSPRTCRRYAPTCQSMADGRRPPSNKCCVGSTRLSGPSSAADTASLASVPRAAFMPLRRNHLHQVSHDLVKQYDRIAIEDLKVTPMLAKRPYLARDIHDAAWTTLTALLDYKAERAGIELVKVDPSDRSSTCPGCNAIAAKPVHQHTHRCGCGFVGDRHVVAAMVVHHRAFGCWPGAGQGSPSLDSNRA